MKRERFTEEDKRTIRKLRSKGRTYEEISSVAACRIDTDRRYGVSERFHNASTPESARLALGLTARPAWFEEDIGSMMIARRMF